MKGKTKLAALLLSLSVMGYAGVAVAQRGETAEGEKSGKARSMQSKKAEGGMRCPMKTGMRGKRMGMGDVSGHLSMYIRNANALNLTAEKTRQLERRLTALRAEQSEFRENMAAERNTLKEMLGRENVDMAEVERQVLVIRDLAGDMAVARIRADVDARNTLTPEQRQAAEQLRSRMVQPGGMRGRRTGSAPAETAQPQGE